MNEIWRNVDDSLKNNTTWLLEESLNVFYIKTSKNSIQLKLSHRDNVIKNLYYEIAAWFLIV